VQLERLSVALRPRGGWEALDLGFQMARGWWRPVWGTWLAVYLPAAAVLHVLFQETLWIAPLVLWWLKPVFDRFVLHVVSRAVFGAPPTVAEALRAWRVSRARADGIAPFIVFHDSVLHEIASRRPGTRGELAAVPGVGPAKLDSYADEVLAALADVA